MIALALFSMLHPATTSQLPPTHPVSRYLVDIDELPTESVRIGRDWAREVVYRDEALGVDERGVVGRRGRDVGVCVAEERAEHQSELP